MPGNFYLFSIVRGNYEEWKFSGFSPDGKTIQRDRVQMEHCKNVRECHDS